jgi:5-methylcytosine-specific restriction endonuclease McrA
VRYEKGPEDNRKKKAGFIGVSRATLRALFGDNCVFCGQTMLFNPRDSSSLLYATMEHMTPRSLGGGKTWDNMRLSCRACNNEKKTMNEEEYRAWRKENK